MALAVTHVIGAIFILDILRHYVFGKEKFPRYLLLVGGIAGLAPDLDIPLSWFLTLITGTQFSLHGAFSHSIFFVIGFVLLALIFKVQQNTRWEKIFYVIAAGWMIHILLDCAFNSYETFLWPLTFNTQALCPQGLSSVYRNGIDAIVLIVWLVHEELHQRIRDYI